MLKTSDIFFSVGGSTVKNLKKFELKLFQRNLLIVALIYLMKLSHDKQSEHYHFQE